jgi:hypothetical protein
MSENIKETKKWTNYGFFQTYEAAKTKSNEIKDQFELRKIKFVKEKSKKGWFKLKVWNIPIKQKATNRKKRKKESF